MTESTDLSEHIVDAKSVSSMLKKMMPMFEEQKTSMAGMGVLKPLAKAITVLADEIESLKNQE